MAGRIIKDSICTNAAIDGLSREAELFFYRLLVQCDNCGRTEWSTDALIKKCYPLRIDKITPSDIDSWVTELIVARLVEFCLINRVQHLRLKKSDLHQAISLRPSTEEWKALRSVVFERDNYTCRYCGVHGGPLHCDHVVPVSRGGSNELSNLTTACVTCNQAKHNKTPEEWQR